MLPASKAEDAAVQIDVSTHSTTASEDKTSSAENDSNDTRPPPKSADLSLTGWAMPAKNVTSKLKAAVDAARLTTPITIQWGKASYLEKVDISSVSNEKLKRHLTERGENIEGNKKQLLERLRNSLEEEKQREQARSLKFEEKHRAIADLEEQGSVYAVGKNRTGELGLGDLDDRDMFAVIPILRGKGVQHVATGGSMSLATTERHEVYSWGGLGAGPMGFTKDIQRLSNFATPQTGLNGEEIVMTAIGANHAVAISVGGDLFVWGCGQFGVLGTGDTTNEKTPRFLDTDSFDATATVEAVHCGEKHTFVKTRQNAVYSWGYCANGRLGVGKDGNTEQPFSSSPRIVKFPSKETVKFISCGSEHTLACTSSSMYSWGSGDGGRLGHGPDFSDRWEPCEIVALRGSHILDICAGTWHSACVICIPVMRGCGLLYTWGSGYQGQLGLGSTCKATTPTMVPELSNGQLSVKRIFCGSYHNAAIASDGNLYTWGSNKHGALGRVIEEKNKSFTPIPGIVIEFGTIVNRIGRGLPRSVACGREYTIVATYPYDGSSEEEAIKIMEQKRLRDEAEKSIQEELERQKEDKLKRQRDADMERKKILYLTSKRLCMLDPKCPGFTYETNQQSICRECGFSVVYHTIVVDESNEDGVIDGNKDKEK